MQTTGEKRVRIDFNAAGSSKVDEVKRKSAECIDLVEGLKIMKAEGGENGSGNARAVLANDGEQLRLMALAQTAYEEAAMWAVKAITYSK